jgi:hypothetical protein
MVEGGGWREKGSVEEAREWEGGEEAGHGQGSILVTPSYLLWKNFS